MSEVIILRFVDFSPNKAQSMVLAARDFAVSKPDGKVGPRHGTVYGFGWGHATAHWTKSRAVVVCEVSSG